LQETCDFTIQLLDSTDKPRFVDLSFDKDKWAEYVENYVQSDHSQLDVRKHKLFLLRWVTWQSNGRLSAYFQCSFCHTRNQRRWAERGADPMEGIFVFNGLECKICLTTYRLFYVQDTQDFFYRRYALSILWVAREQQQHLYRSLSFTQGFTGQGPKRQEEIAYW